MTVYPQSHFVSDKGVSVGGVLLQDLAAKYGTPLYVMDEFTIRQNCKRYTEPLLQSYPDSLVVYAGKANLNIPLINVIASEGLGLDVVSGGELYTALKSNIDPTKIYFHGNNKSLEELRMALTNEVVVVVDNMYEIQHIESLCNTGLKAKILIRLKPEIEAHTHEYIKTGQIDSKFGFDVRDLDELMGVLSKIKGLTYLGIHSHIGSQIFDTKPFLESVTIMMNHIERIYRKTGTETLQLNLGGGIGIQYIDSDKPPLISEYINAVAEKVKKECEKRQLTPPKIIFEPGRSIVGNAGITLYTVGAIKNIQDIKCYLFVDGGMADNPRPILYQAEYTYGLARYPFGKENHTYSIAGKFCESGDILANNIVLPEVEVGDVLVVYGTGAYNYAMASNYNRSLKPAMVSVMDQQSKIWVKRETWNDLIRNDLQ
jgi:diaminopimelate decarboxylase